MTERPVGLQEHRAEQGSWGWWSRGAPRPRAVASLSATGAERDRHPTERVAQVAP